jgi:hypothetical protein
MDAPAVKGKQSKRSKKKTAEQEDILSRTLNQRA